MGRRGAELMLARLEGRRRRPKGIVLEPELIVRRSSGEPIGRRAGAR
jgi:DNA-binding LacI/PurR family transcriptional regulator